MDWMNILGKYVDRPQSGAGEGDVHRDFEQVAQQAPRSSLVEGLVAAFRSNQTPSFGSTLANLFSQANTDQKAGILGHLLSMAPAAASSQIAGLFGANRDASAEQAQQMSPQRVEEIANEAAQRDPGIMNKVSEFLAGHPNLLKNLDQSSLSAALSHIGTRLGGGRTMTGGGGV